MADQDVSAIQRGPIAYMARNGVAANLLMVAILVGGLSSLTGIEQEAWPEIPFNTVEVAVAYPGASPEEVEESVVVKIEDRVKALDDVRSVRAIAGPGAASVQVELMSGTDIGRTLDEIKSAVDGIESFPADAERPRFTEMTNRQSVIRLIVHGDVPERALKELAYRIEDDLASLADVSLVQVSGVRDYEISIEVPMRRLRALGLTLTDIAAAVRTGALDLPAGSIDTGDTEVRIRSVGQRYDQQDFEDIVLVTAVDGTTLRLGDVAEVRDGFEASNLIVRHNGLPAAFVEISRADNEPVGDVAAAVAAYVDGTLRPSLPPGVAVTVWNDESEVYTERRDLLVKNGGLGLLLVFLALALFLEIRLAVWVAVGIGVAGVGSLAAMLAFDLSMNSVSLFAFVLAIGIVVDDAIVVAEQVYSERKAGAPGVAAAIRGARRVSTPLTFAVFTSMAAFSPLLFLPGGIGEIMAPVPVVLIAMLLLSLVESLFILPRHLSHLPGPEWKPVVWADRWLAGVQARVNGALSRFVEGPLTAGLQFAVRQPAVVIAGALGMLIVTVSLLPAGIVGTAFAETVEGDFVTANLEMPDGTSARRTHEVARELEAAGRRAMERLSRNRGGGELPLSSGGIITVGQKARIEGGGLFVVPSLNPEANIATVEFKLLGAGERDISTSAVMSAWREEVGDLPYARSLTFTGEIIALGNPVEAVLSHPDQDRLREIADATMAGLAGIQGVFDIRSDHAPGVREIQLALRDEARTLGLTMDAMSKQVRAAFHGEEAVRVQRGREEVRAYVRLPTDERDAVTDIESYMVPLPGGGFAPLGQLARLESGTAAPSIRRRDGDRVVTVTADVDTSVISSGEAIDFLMDTTLADLSAADSELSVRFGGEAEQQLRVLRRVESRVHPGVAGHLRDAGDSSAVLHASPDRDGGHSLRADRGHPRPPRARHPVQQHVGVRIRRTERRRGKRLAGHDRLLRAAVAGRRAVRDRDRRSRQGPISTDHAHIGDYFRRIHAAHPRAGDSREIPDSLCGVARIRVAGDDGRPDHAGPPP